MYWVLLFIVLAVASFVIRDVEKNNLYPLIQFSYAYVTRILLQYSECSFVLGDHLAFLGIPLHLGVFEAALSVL